MRNYFLCIICFAFFAVTLYNLKYNVHSAQKETARLEAKLISERERLHMVELEWTRLSRPERIAALAREHLSLQHVQPQDVMHTTSTLWKVAQRQGSATPQ